MRLDRRALGYAILVEGVLIFLAAFGGPYGQLGFLPWILQLPGIVLVLFLPGETWFLWRIVGMGLVQVVLWYALIAIVRRWRRGRSGTQARAA